MILWTFFNTSPWFNACFKFIICITYSFSSGKLTTFFLLFQPPFFQAKRLDHCEGHVIFRDIDHQLQESILRFYLHFSCLQNFTLNWHVFSTHLKPFANNTYRFWYILTLKIWWFFIFTITFDEFIISFYYISTNSMRYSAFDNFLYH